MAKYKNSSGGLGRFWAILLTLILIAGIVLGVVYRKQVAVMWGDITRYFQRVDDEATSDDEPSEETPSEDETEPTENMIVSDVETNGLTLAMVPMAASDISEQAESGLTLTATVSPSYATNKALDWTVSFVDDSEEWAQGKTATDYVTITPTADGAETAVLECLQPFGAQLVVRATSRDNAEAYATCTLDYLTRVKGMTLYLFNANNEGEQYAYFDMASGENSNTVEVTTSMCGLASAQTEFELTAGTIDFSYDDNLTLTWGLSDSMKSYMKTKAYYWTNIALQTQDPVINASYNIDLQYIGLYIHYIVIASRKADFRYDTIEEYLDIYDSEYLLIANSFAATYPDDYAFYFLATYSIDGVEYTHRLNFNYISDYFEIPVADVEMDNSGVIL